MNSVALRIVLSADPATAVESVSTLMGLTDHHAKCFAHELTKGCSSDSMEQLAGAYVEARVDLNPHQVEVALFAFKSPVSKDRSRPCGLSDHLESDRG